MPCSRRNRRQNDPSAGAAPDVLGVDAHRERLDGRRPAVVPDPTGLAVDGRRRDFLGDALQEAPAVPLDVEPQQVVAKQPLQQVPALRAGPKHVRTGPGDVPELRAERRRARLVDHLRREREVVVLEPDRPAVGVLEDGVGERPADPPVGPPVVGVEVHPSDIGVTERPERPVGVPR